MKFFKTQRIVIFLLISILALTNCSRPDPIAYNDSLVALQTKAFEIDSRVDAEFNEKFWADTIRDGFLDEKSKEFALFKEKYSAEYNQLLTQLDTIPDMEEGKNEMKKALRNIINFLNVSIDTYYGAMLNNIPKGGVGIPLINSEYNLKMKDLFNLYIITQKKLLQEEGLEPKTETTTPDSTQAK